MAMEEGCRSTQLIDGNGEFNATGLRSFIESAKLSKCGVSYAVVAIMGPQSSGKSVLLNNLFGTDFVVMDATKGRSQTTKGIWIAKADDVEPLTIVLDIEGNDGQERGEDKKFERQSAMFALAVADVVLINVWVHDVGREDGAGKPLLRNVFEVTVKLSISAPTLRKTTLLFVVRDVTTESPPEKLKQQLIVSTEKIWMEVCNPKARKNSALSDFFTVKVTTLPHYTLQKQEFKEEVAKLKKKFQNSIAPGGLAGDRQGVVAASGFEFSAQQMWKIIRENKDLDLPTHKMAVACFRCDELITEITRRFREDKRWLEIETAAISRPLLIPNFGKKLSSILETFLSMYDKEAEYFEEGVRNAKRKTLESNLLQVVRPAYETLLNHLLTHATESFKTKLKEALSRGNKGFATCVLECTTSCMGDFDKRCADAKIQQADWNKYSSIVRDKVECKINGRSSYVREKKLSEIVTRLEKKLSVGCLEDSTVSFLKQGNKDSWPSIRKLLCEEIESVSSEFNGSIFARFELEESRREEILQGLKNYATRIVEKAAKDTAKTQRVLSYMKDRFSSLILNHDQDSNSRPSVHASKWFSNLVRLGGGDSRRWNGDEDIDEIVSYATRECVGLLSVMAAIRLDEQVDDIESRLMSSFLPNNKKYYPLDFNPFTFWNGDRNNNSSWDKVSQDYILITPLKCDEIREQFLSDIPETVNKFRETLVDTANSSCEEIAGEILGRFRADKRWLELETAAAKSPPSLGFGNQLSSLLDIFLSMYDKETELEVFNHQGVRDAKRKKLAFDLLQLARSAYETKLKHLIIAATKMFETQLDETLREKNLGLADSFGECRNSCMHQFDEWCADAAIQQAEADCSNASKMAKATLSRKISEHSTSVRDKMLSEIVARLKKKLSDGRLEDETVSLLEKGNKDSWPSIRKLLWKEIGSVSSVLNVSISGFGLEELRRVDLLQGLKNHATRIVENAARDTAKTHRVLSYMTERFLKLFNLDQDSKPRIWKGDENIKEIVDNATTQCGELLSVMAAIRLDEQPDDLKHIISFSSTPEFDGNAEEGSPITNYVDCWNKASPHYTILKPTECREIWKQFISDIQPTINRAIDIMAANNKSAAKKFRKAVRNILKGIATFATVCVTIVGVLVGAN